MTAVEDTVEALEARIKDLIEEQKLLNRTVTSLQRRNLKLQELNTLKDEFIAIASHQLRTPVTAVKQYISLLMGDYVEPLTESQKLFLDKAEESNNRQLTIIDDLLQVARIDSETFKLKQSKFDLIQLLQTVASSAKDALKGRNQTIEFISSAKKIAYEGDRERLTMLFENLIDNASNYSQEKTKILIKVRKARGNVVIDVVDEGVGIAQNDLTKLFTKFSRIPNPRSVEAGGTGLGLYWAQKVANLHGGEIRVKSDEGKGSTFTVILPLK